MGLDISAHGKLEFVETLEDWEAFGEKYSELSGYVFVGGLEFPERLPPLLDNGVYRRFGEHFGFRAGSYSGYSAWREMLCKMTLRVRPKVVWEARDSDLFRGKPFVELIDFSDCEGWIGSEAAVRLAKDFADFQDKANEMADEWFIQKYADWRKAFEIAADGGGVHFH